MRLRLIRSLCLAALTAGIVAAPAAAEKPAHYDASEFPGHSVAFQLEGSNGYSIGVYAYSDPLEGRERIGIGATRGGGAAFYSAPVHLTDTTIEADLGSLGRVDLHLNPSGRQKTIRLKCSGGDTFTYEPGVYEGILEFKGEEGFTAVRETQVPLRPLLTGFCGGRNGYGESRGPGEAGARIRGFSFAHGRTLSFQVNKNHARSRAIFTAEIRERHGNVLIHRTVEGTAPANAFRFDPDLRTAQLSPPAPFSGSATLTRSPDSYSPLLRGNLALDFPGRSNVPLAGPQMHVSLVHACFNHSSSPHSAESC
jgi:hypothetical protein